MTPACHHFRRTLGDRSAADVAAREHVAICARCAAHADFAQRIGGVLATRVPAPDRLRSPEFLAGVHERIVVNAAATPIFQALASPAPLPAQVAEWPAPVLHSEVASSTVTAPSTPSTETWHRVHDAILAELTAPRTSWAMRAWFAAGIAAAAVLGGLALTTTTKPPEIVFVDLVQAPTIDFAVVRRGVMR